MRKRAPNGSAKCQNGTHDPGPWTWHTVRKMWIAKCKRCGRTQAKPQRG